MSLDLSTCGVALRKAVESIFDCSNQWLILAYGGGGYTLELDSTGSSKEDMFENFSPSRVMYGFVRLDDPTSTGLSKYVFIIWQGEAAQEKYKIVCSQHVIAVKNLFKTVHLTITARSDSDLDWDEIDSKLRQSSFFGRTAPAVPNDDATIKPVASVYKRVDPREEIKASSLSHQFWREKQMETKNGEPPVRKNSSGYKKIDPQAEITMARNLARTTVDDDNADTTVRSTGYKKIDPRAEITLARKLSHTSVNDDKADTHATTHSMARQEPELHNKNGKPYEEKTSAIVSPVQQMTTPVPAPPIPPLGKSTTEPSPAVSPTSEPARPDSFVQQQVSIRPPNEKHAASSLTALCLYDYTAGESDEVSFRQGDYIYYIQKVDEGWWIGSTESGQMGLFPANYVQLLT